ncbi:hypothetical protein ACFRMQ_09580 [Kitasatospora sp. NPDC056783]|uniref:hypothetical protein n=1 Tax=Kitasatospora sp. NPDC056783 TaxID=3345943 RepID=UPI0036CAC2E6
MTLPALASMDQLAAWLQRDPTDLPPGAASVLDMASAVVRREARTDFTRRTTTAQFTPRDGWITLPLRPVVRVDSVSVVGTPLAPSEFELVRDRLRVKRYPYTPALVTYTAGYSAVPADVLSIVLTLAGRVVTNPNDLRQEAVGGVSVTYAAETIGAGLAPAERDQLARYRRRAAVVSLE